MRPPRLSLIAAFAAACALAACTRTPSPEATGDTGRDASPPAATPAEDAAPQAGAAPELQAYYDALVARHGQDYAACGPAEDVRAGACPQGEAQAADAPRRVLLMLDASGSMAGREGGRTKLALAQDALLDFVRRLEGDAQVALRVYGHRGSNRQADKAASCRGTELVHPFGPRDAAAFAASVRAFQPRGFTPIAASLQAAARDFAQGGADARGNVVYLVSDGIETCDGDPVAAAQALRASDIGVVVNVIGFDVDAQAERQLREVAASGGGDYIAARSGADLAAVFNARIAAMAAQFNCRVRAESGAFNRTVGTQATRFNCLVGKATTEFNAVVGAASADRNAGRATGAQRDYAVQQAGAKRDGIVKPAAATRDAAVSDAGRRRDTGVDAASRERARAQDAAVDARQP